MNNQQIENAKNIFLKRVHQLWVTDVFDMDYFMTCLEALMIKEGVMWKSVVELDTENMTRAFSNSVESEQLFEEDVNDRSKDRYENFFRVADTYMCFDKMYSLPQNHVA